MPSVPASDTASPPVPGQQAAACTPSEIVMISSQLVDGATGRLRPEAGITVGFANGSFQTFSGKLPEIRRSLLGDQVQLCPAETSARCPPGSTGSGAVRVTNERTRETWTLPNSRRCTAT